MPDSHLLNILSDTGVSVDRNVGSPTSLLSAIRLNEEARAAIAKAKEALAEKAMTTHSGVAGPSGAGSGLAATATKKGRSSKAKSCVAPCRSSLRIKNLSFR